MNAMRNNEPPGGGDKQPESPAGEHVKDRDAIAQGIAEIEADGGTALNEAFDDIRASLGLSSRRNEDLRSRGNP